MATRRTQEEIQSLLKGYRQRTVTRAEYLPPAGHRHQHTGQLPSALRSEADALRQSENRCAGLRASRAFVLVLSNGRRIESGWQFHDADLARLIRVAEAE